MFYIADLHLHSKYSRAVSQNMDLEEIAQFALKKGIDIVATGDWTHPLWFREIKNKLQEVKPGLFSLKNSDEKTKKINFILATEVSSIYSQNNRLYRIHNLIFSPSFPTAEKIIAKLQQKGVNLLADGRPIMGLSARDLYALIKEIDEKTFLIPCHIWTPWFSLYGSRSGFDSIKDCFLDMEKEVFAVETGLSSDPWMNWQIEELDNRQIVSFSDAHSGQKLGREATVFFHKDKEKNLSYDDLIEAMKNQSSRLKIAYTIEFFPEEGKYHWSGHRRCGIKYSPDEEKEKGRICPICHQPLTIGVESRVFQLSSRLLKKDDLIFVKNKNDVVFVYEKTKKRPPYVSLVPLLEILNEVYQSPTKANREYEKITQQTPEFDFLLRASYKEIEALGGEILAEAIKRVRNQQVTVEPGFDGVFGQVKILKKDDEKKQSLFSQKSKDNQQNTLF